jgi:hypothetical protein
MARQIGYQPPAYSFKNRGVNMSTTPKVLSYDDGKTYVEVRGVLLSRREVETSSRLLTEHDAAEQRRLIEEQQKKDEEAKRQATIALRASKHGLVRSHYDDGGYLLLDPVRVREALKRADDNGGMVTLHTWGGMNYDPVEASLGSTERRIPFTVQVTK